MIPISEIPNLDDGDCVPIIEGTLKQVNPVETKESKDKVDAAGNPKKYRTQWFIVESLSGSILVSTFNEAMFVPETDAGKEIKLCAQKVNGVYKGLEKTSYVKADGKTSTSVQAGNGCIRTIKQPKSETTPIMPDKPKPETSPARGETPPERTSPCANPQPATDTYQRMARLHAYAFTCLNEAHELAGWKSSPEAMSAAATGILIQHHYEAPKKIAPSTKAPALDHAKDGDVEKAPAKPAAVPLKEPTGKREPLTTEQLATKVIGGIKVTAEMLEGVNLEAVFDMCYTDATHEHGADALNQAFDEIKAKVKTEAKLYPSILMRWDDFTKKAAGFKAAKEVMMEDDIPF
jgi:hypothetical protein